MNVFIGTCSRRFAGAPGRQTAFSVVAPYRTAYPPSAILSQTTRLHTRSSLSKPLPSLNPTLSPQEWRFLPFLQTLRRSAREYYKQGNRAQRPPPPRSPPPPPNYQQGNRAQRPPPPRSPPPPPKQSWWKRFTQRLDRLPQNYVTGGIIGLNVLVWMQWKVGWQNFSRFKDEQPLRFLFENFATSWENYRAGRWWTLITAAFSQMEEGHLLINCLSLWFTADAVMSVIGVSRFMGVYLLGGVASSIVSIWWRGDKQGHSLGASGAVYACLSLFGLMFPTTKFLIFFVLPVPAWACIGGILAWDLWGMFSKQGKNVEGGSDNAGHVGGILAGAAMYWFRFRGFVPRW